MDPTSSPHLQIINKPAPEETYDFPQFAQFPAEIRSIIWEMSLSCERLIRVGLKEGTTPEDTPADLERHRRDRDQGDPSLGISDPFVVVLQNRYEISKLFRVCPESRHVAMRFYRVHVPCFYKKYGQPSVKGTFYFHPELDIVDLQGQRFLARFAHMIWTHDPRGVGLINLGLAKKSYSSVFFGLFREQDTELLRQALARLRCVIFGYDGFKGRAIPRHEDFYERFITESEIVRSRPLLASISKFQRLPQDPRQVADELKRVYMGFGDPRDILYRWFRLLEQFHVEYPNHSVQYRLMVTYDSRRVSNWEQAHLALQEEDEDWEKWMVKCQKEMSVCIPEDLEMPSAFGFWLFPIEVLGPIPKANPRIHHTGLMSPEKNYGVWNHTKKWDLSSHQPELCLQYLPESHETPCSRGPAAEKGWEERRREIGRRALPLLKPRMREFMY